MKLLETENGKIIISVILGLGLASMFRKICNTNNCLVIKGPKLKEMNKYYRIDKTCYKYKPYPIECEK
tara:strand:- start:5182 stop:5385 length:204 start_codon:yes stop_codon:yes gene_type:complete